jgi:hypothetical protein
MFDRKHKYSCTTCGIRRVTLVKDPTMNHVKGQEFYNIQNTNVYIKFSAHDEDARVFSSIKNEQKYTWLYDSVVHQGYLCKFCELFCGHSSSSQNFVTVGINLGTV